MKTQANKNIADTGSAPILHSGLSPRQSPKYADMTEQQLIESCQRRDKAAFRQLLKTYERFVMSVLYRLAPELADKSDLAQEVFVRMWKSIDRLQNPRALRGWVSQIATHVFYDELRRRHPSTVSLDSSKFQDNGDETPPIQIADPSPLPDELIELRELRHMMEQALVQIPVQFRMMVTMRDIDGLSYSEISEITQSGLGTVKSRISRARVKMQLILSPYISGCETEKTKVKVRRNRTRKPSGGVLAFAHQASQRSAFCPVQLGAHSGTGTCGIR